MPVALSQSSLLLVLGSARLSPRKLASDRSAYVSPSWRWNDDSVALIDATTDSGDGEGESVADDLSVVESWTLPATTASTTSQRPRLRT